MKNVNGFVKSLAAGSLAMWLAQSAPSGVPLNNLEGVGGIAFNPVAYPAGQNKDSSATNRW